MKFWWVICSFVTLFFPVAAYGQNYGNEWIDYSNDYFRINITQQGVYKITRQTLSTAGFPVSTVNPKNIQLFFRGVEQPIYIKGENDFVFDNGDYILFYAQPNDGWLDSALYENSTEQTNPYYSLINDTSAYFLTWKTDATVKKRYTVETDTTFSAYLPTDYCRVIQINSYTSGYYFGSDIATYSKSEGWFDDQVFSNATRTKAIILPGLISSGNVNLEICVAGVPNSDVESNVPHQLIVDINSNTYIDTFFSGYEFIRHDFSVVASQLTNSFNINFTSAYISSAADRQTVAYVKADYYHDFDLSGQSAFEFYMDNATSQSKSLLEFQNFSSSGNGWLFDMTNNKMCLVDNGKVLVPNGIALHHSYLTSENSIQLISNIEKVTFTDFLITDLNSDYIIITNKKLWLGATNYANYRQTSGYNCLLVDVKELYDQFSYGIRQHPLSIKNFLRYVVNNYDTLPKTILLFGKSVHPYVIRNNATYYAESLVPTFGDPSSDNLFVAGINGSLYDLAIPIGRISASTNDEGDDYLQKVMAYESNVPAEWMKQILHFGGGNSGGQQAQFAGYLATYEQTIEDTLFGGNVHTFLKNTSQPMQITQSDSISNLINNGISIMTFFGHGSTSGFDQNIDYPTAFNNYNKYPVLMAASCLAGDIHLPLPQYLSEQWVMIPNKGSIAFFASASTEYSSPLHTILNELYKQISYENYQQRFGYQIQQTFKTLGPANLNNKYLLKTVLDYTLLGDPAIVINSFANPDLTISSADISTIPSYVSSVIDSFDVRIVVTNIGRATTDTFIVELQRTFPNGNIEMTQLPMAGCLYKDSLTIKLPVSSVNGNGINQLCVNVDLMNQIVELDETNNDACIDFYVHSTDIYPVFPYEYAIYPYDTVTLVASTGDPFAPMQNIIFQIDTIDTYDSPFRFQTNIPSVGGVVKYHLPITMTDSTVYYWRVGKQGGSHFNESSFIYIPNKTGWSQAHFFQFKNDDYQYIDYLHDSRKFEFISTPKAVHVHNIGSVSSNDYLNVKYDIDGFGDNSCCGAAGAMIVAVIDSMTLQPWTSDRQDYGHRDYPKCFSRNRPDYYFVFSTDTTNNSINLENMATFINSVPNGDYIVAYSWSYGNFQNWSENAYLAFENLGASNIRYIQSNIPYIFFCQKGNLSFVQWKVGSSSTSVIDLTPPSVELPTNYYYGNINSVKIGPSIFWDSFHWRTQPLENPTADSVYVSIKGLDMAGNETTLLSHISMDSLDIYNLSNTINASSYPFLKLRFFTYDDSSLTPSQMKRWQLTYNEVAETAINPPKGFYLSADSINEGGDIAFGVATENVSPYDMDSLMVTYQLIDQNNSVHAITTKHLRPHPSGDVLMDTISVNTLNFVGLNRLRVEYNPVNPSKGYYDQLEQYHFNNIAEISFNVTRDLTNPILDVTFDGRHILDGEIVSAKPIISIKLKDENKFLALNDTSSFAVYLKSIDDNQEERIYFKDQFGNDVLLFTPAQLPNNSCIITYQPMFSKDGIYELRVQAKDISENESGDDDYHISFEVVNQSTITNVFNYPNPFSTATHFVFTLTGSVVPDLFMIKIFTVTGRLVKVIDLTQVENIHIGNNITTYIWDGTDDYGDKLSNGVYFYQVITKINGNNIDKRNTNTDQYFKRGFGKLYILR